MKGYLRLYTFIFWILPNLAKYSHGLSPLKQASQNWKNGKNSAYQGFKKFVFSSLTCSQIWLKSSCGWLPVHLPHKIAKKNENKKKKPLNNRYLWSPLVVTRVLGRHFRVRVEGSKWWEEPGRLTRYDCAPLSAPYEAAFSLLRGSVHRDRNVVSCALFLDPRLCSYLFLDLICVFFFGWRFVV
jgi:hypothetical protein